MGGLVSASPCRERRGDVALLAIGRLDASDVARVQAHVDGCAACRAALHELRSIAEVLPLVDAAPIPAPAAPPADLADRILRQVRDERRAHDARRRRHVTAVAAAAAIALLVVIAGFVVIARDDSPTTHDFAVEAPGVDGSFSIQANAEGTAVTLVHEGLDPEDVYWLWLTDASGQRVSAGTFHGSTDRSSLVLQSAMTADAAVRIWVTDEDDAVVLDSQL
jgi:anti-sigma-K factor RskA